MKTFLFCFVLGIPMVLRAEKFENPQYEKKDSHSIEITSIEITNHLTIINFIHTAPDYYVDGGWVNLKKEIYLKDNNGIKYPLVKVEGIPLSPNRHKNSCQGQKLYFTAYFERLPLNTSLIDIVECPDSYDCFNFYGIKLTKINTGENNRFRRNFSHFAIYTPDSGWENWEEGYNTIVFNTNGNGDIIFYYASGTVEKYRKVSKIEKYNMDSGISYQSITILNENGEEFGLRLFDEGTVQLVTPSGTIFQFKNIEQN